MNVKSVLTELNLPITSERDEFVSFCPSFRGSDNNMAASVNLKTGLVTDFVTNEFYSLGELIQKVTGKSLSKAELKKYEASIQVVEKEEELNYWSKDSLDLLLPDHSYWMGRGVSKETLRFFQGGVSHGGKLIRRYVFPIFDRHKRIVGFTGRDTTGKSDIKWKHEGKSANFLFGVFNKSGETMPVLNSIIEKRHVVIAEGPSDVVAAYDEGLKIVVPKIGLNISKTLLSFLVGVNPDKITICGNQDENFRGQNAAVKDYAKLYPHFGPEVLEIKYPFGNDLAENKDKIKNFLGKPPENALMEFRKKWVRCEEDKKNGVKSAVKMAKGEIKIGGELGKL